MSTRKYKVGDRVRFKIDYTYGGVQMRGRIGSVIGVYKDHGVNVRFDCRDEHPSLVTQERGWWGYEFLEPAGRPAEPKSFSINLNFVSVDDAIKAAEQLAPSFGPIHIQGHK